MKEPAHKLEVRIVRSGYDQESYDLYRRYQIAIHHDADDKPTTSVELFSVNLCVRVCACLSYEFLLTGVCLCMLRIARVNNKESAVIRAEVFYLLTFILDNRVKGYKRFLVKSPLQFVPPTDAQAAAGFPGFGSFHQQYRIDGKLICVGVIGMNLTK